VPSQHVIVRVSWPIADGGMRFLESEKKIRFSLSQTLPTLLTHLRLFRCHLRDRRRKPGLRGRNINYSLETNNWPSQYYVRNCAGTHTWMYSISYTCNTYRNKQCSLCSFQNMSNLPQAIVVLVSYHDNSRLSLFKDRHSTYRLNH
jgi:hypothetical protein